MGYYSTQVTAGGTLTEIKYMQLVIDAIVGADSRITCNTSSAEQFADLSSASTAKFDFDIDGKYTLRLLRGANNATATYRYIISIIVNGSEYAKDGGNRCWYAQTYPTSVLNACYFKVTSFSNSGCICLWLGIHHDQPISALFPTSRIAGLVYSTNDIAYCTSNYNTNDLMSQAYYLCSSGATGNYIVNALSYAESAGKLSYIENAPIKSSGYFASYAKTIHACTTIGMGTSVALADGNKYFAVGSNAIALIEDE